MADNRPNLDKIVWDGLVRAFTPSQSGGGGRGSRNRFNGSRPSSSGSSNSSRGGGNSSPGVTRIKVNGVDVEYDMGDPAQVSALNRELEEINKDQSPTNRSAGNAGGAQSVDPDKSGYIKPTPPSGGGDSAPPSPTPPQPEGGSSVRNTDAPDGSGAKGTNTGFKGFDLDLNTANAALAKLGIGGLADANSFLSAPLPVSPGGDQARGLPVGYVDSEGNKITLDGDNLTDFQESLTKLGPKNMGVSEFVYEGSSTPGKDGATQVDSADNTRALSVPGESRRSGMPGNSRSNGTRQRGFEDARFEDGSEYGEDYATDYSKGRTAFRNAFLAGDRNSAEALRAGEAAVGHFVAGGKNYRNEGGTLKEVNIGAKGGNITAEDLKGAYVTSIKEDLKPSDKNGNDRDDETSKGYKTITPDDPIAAEAFGQDWVDANKGNSRYKTISPDDPIAAEAFGQDWVDANKGKGRDNKVDQFVPQDAAVPQSVFQYADTPAEAVDENGKMKDKYFDKDNVTDEWTMNNDYPGT